ncbi:hypothetical protein AU381_01295 [Sinorhizobium glycinis]|uniref:Transposase n=1 Tax=Sinorhizobium glycinis TaxID=1472378 RepID=A0A178XZH0_9HYPH|nr:hypothetical protein AU381_01295 [Sinorhizobium glycinis]
MIKAVARTLLAFEALGKMPAHVYMRLTAVLRLMLSLLFDTLDFERRSGDRYGRTANTRPVDAWTA